MHWPRDVLFWYLTTAKSADLLVSSKEERGDSLCRFAKFLDGSIHVLAHVLDVEIDPVQHRALVDDEGAQVLEELSKLGDALCDLVNFSIPLHNVVVCQRGSRLLIE